MPDLSGGGSSARQQFIAELQEVERLTVQLLSWKSLNPENPDSDNLHEHPTTIPDNVIYYVSRITYHVSSVGFEYSTA